MNEVCSICSMIKHNVFDEFNTNKYDLLPRGSLDQKHSWTEIIDLHSTPFIRESKYTWRTTNNSKNSNSI